MDKQRTEQLDPIKAIRMAGRAKGRIVRQQACQPESLLSATAKLLINLVILIFLVKYYYNFSKDQFS
jgi:hypothetical protein